MKEKKADKWNIYSKQNFFASFSFIFGTYFLYMMEPPGRFLAIMPTNDKVQPISSSKKWGELKIVPFQIEFSAKKYYKPSFLWSDISR